MVTTIPLYQWLWINKNNNHMNHHTATKITLFEYEKQQFTTMNMREYVDYTVRLEAILEEISAEYNLDHHISFWILSESWRGRWFGFTWVLCAWLGHYIIENNWRWWEKTQDAAIHIAMRIETALRWIHANGDRIVASLQTQAPTIIYSRWLYDTQLDQQKNTKEVYKSDGNEQGAFTQKWWFIPLDTSQAFFPFDWCVLFSWNVADVSTIDRSLVKHEKKREKQAEQILALEKTITNDGRRHTYIGQIAQEGRFYEILYDALVIAVAQYIMTLKDILDRNDEEHKSIQALEHFNEITHLAELLQWNTQVVKTIQTYFSQKALSQGEILGCIPLYYGKYWGSYLLATPYGKSRNTLEKTIQALQEVNDKVSIEYASWRDGTIHGGVVVHQHISAGIYSSFIHKDFLRYTNNKWENEIGVFDELFAKHKTWILLDVEANRVYINGEKITSEHLKSQTTTVELLNKLLDKQWESVSNTAFLPSSFTRQQNQMIGKILWPLRKLCKKVFNKEIEIKCVGTLRKFTITLEEKEIPVGKIQKII